MNLDLSVIDWVIVGDEPGPNHRPIEAQWVKRVSTTGQDLGAQLAALAAAVDVRRVFDERRPESPGEVG